MRDRTREYISIVGALRTTEKLIENKVTPPTRFTTVAGSCISTVKVATRQLDTLQRLVSEENLFSQNDGKFNQLIFSVKKTAKHLNDEISFLQTAATRPPRGSQISQHYYLMLNQLKRSALEISRRFQKLLAERNNSVKTRANRFSRFGQVAESSAFGFGAAQSFNVNPPSAAYSRVQTNDPNNTGSVGLRSRGIGRSRPAAAPYVHANRVRIPGNVSGVTNLLGDGEQPLLISSQVYRSNRTNKVKGIEKHIAELGKMFGKLTELVASQAEAVEHIDDNIDNAFDDVDAGQKELLKYYEYISRNRSLILKIFGILITSISLYMYVKS